MKKKCFQRFFLLLFQFLYKNVVQHFKIKAINHFFGDSAVYDYHTSLCRRSAEGLPPATASPTARPSAPAADDGLPPPADEGPPHGTKGPLILPPVHCFSS